MVNSRTEPLRLVPGAIRDHVLSPEWERRALCRFRLVDRTALRIIEVDAGARLSARLEYPATITYPTRVSRQPLSARELVLLRQTVSVFLGEIDDSTGFVAAASAVGQAGELHACRPPAVIAIPKHSLPACHHLTEHARSCPTLQQFAWPEGLEGSLDEAESASHLYALHSCPETPQEVWAK